MTQTRTAPSLATIRSRIVFSGLLLAGAATLAGCGGQEHVSRTTTTNESTSQQLVPAYVPASSVTTTQTRQNEPGVAPDTSVTTTRTQGSQYLVPGSSTTTTRTQQITP